MIIFCVLTNVHATTKNSFEPWKQYDDGKEEQIIVTMGKFKVIKSLKIKFNKKQQQTIEKQRTQKMNKQQIVWGGTFYK